MNIYEITEALNDFLEKTVFDTTSECFINTETGEIVEKSEFEKLQMKREEKIENTAKFYKNQLALLNSISKEIEELKQREKLLKAKIDSLKELLRFSLAGEKFETGAVKISYRKSQSVNVIDLDKLEEVYKKIETTIKADKTAIKEALKKGIEIDGAELVTNNNIIIK